MINILWSAIYRWLFSVAVGMSKNNHRYYYCSKSVFTNITLNWMPENNIRSTFGIQDEFVRCSPYWTWTRLVFDTIEEIDWAVLQKKKKNTNCKCRKFVKWEAKYITVYQILFILVRRHDPGGKRNCTPLSQNFLKFWKRLNNNQLTTLWLREDEINSCHKINRLELKGKKKDEIGWHASHH